VAGRDGERVLNGKGLNGKGLNGKGLAEVLEAEQRWMVLS
jgi:hypothetical protein